MFISPTELQNIPPADKTSGKLQKNFVSTDVGRLKRQLRGYYDIIYVIDSSSSISRFEFRKGIQAIQILVDRAAPESLHAVIAVASRAHVIFSFTSGAVAKRNLETLQRMGGKSNMQEALHQCDQLFRSPSAGARTGSYRRVLIVTDGQSNVQRDKTLWKAMELKLRGAELFVVGVGEYVEGIDELVLIASSLDAHLYRAGDMQGLVEIVKLIPPVNYRRDWAAEMIRLRESFVAQPK